MPLKKTFTSIKKPTVTVQTKKMSDDCCVSSNKMSNKECCGMQAHYCFGKMFLVLLLIVNVVLTSIVLIRQSRIESMRVGGNDNYRMLQQVFESEGFQAQQRQQIQQAMQLYQVPATDVSDAAGAIPVK